MRDDLSDDQKNEKLSEIGEFTTSILDAQTEEVALILLQRGINEGPFDMPTSEVAENLFHIINYTFKWPSVRSLAIKQLKSLHFSEGQALRNENILMSIFCREKINLMIRVKAVDTPEDEALASFREGVRLGFFENKSDVVLRGLLAIAIETPHDSLRIEVTKILDALKLPDSDNNICLEKVQNDIGHQGEIFTLARPVLESKDELLAIGELIQLYTKFSEAEPKKLQQALRAIFHRSKHEAVRKITQRLLEKISIEVEMDEASRNHSSEESEDFIEPPLTWLPLSFSHSLN